MARGMVPALVLCLVLAMPGWGRAQILQEEILSFWVTPDCQVEIRWEPFNTPGVVKQVLRRAVGESSGGVDVAVFEGNSQGTWLDTEVNKSHTYRYQLQGRNADDEVIVRSQVVTVLVKFVPQHPSVPKVELRGRGITYLELAWEKPDPAEGVVEYVLRRYRPLVEQTVTIPAPALSFRDAGLQPGTAYRYELVARNIIDDYSGKASLEGETLPVPPAGLEVKERGFTWLRLGWEPVVGEDLPLRLQRSGAAGGVELDLLLEEPGFYLDEGLTPGCTYTYRGGFHWEEETYWEEEGVTAATLAPPGDLEARVLEGRRVELTWSPPAAGEVVSQEVYRRAAPEGPWVLVAHLEPEVGLWVDEGVDWGGTYVYKLQLADGRGEGAWTAPVSVGIPAAPPGTGDSPPDPDPGEEPGEPGDGDDPDQPGEGEDPGDPGEGEDSDDPGTGEDPLEPGEGQDPDGPEEGDSEDGAGNGAGPGGKGPGSGKTGEKDRGNRSGREVAAERPAPDMVYQPDFADMTLQDGCVLVQLEDLAAARVRLSRELLGSLGELEQQLLLSSGEVVIALEPARVAADLTGAELDLRVAAGVWEDSGPAPPASYRPVMGIYSIALDPEPEAGPWLDLEFNYDRAGVPPGEEARLGIYRWDPDGGTWSYVGGRVNRSRRVIRVQAVPPGTYTVMSYSPLITDLENHWARQPVEVLASRHLWPREEGFRPQDPLGRGDFTGWLVRILSLPPAGDAGQPFPDVKAGEGYAAEIAAAREAGLVTGRPDGAFHPAAAMTRQELAHLVGKVLLEGMVAVDQERELWAPAGEQFADWEQVEAWAQPGVEAAAAAGLLTGRAQGALHPREPATRAEGAALLARLLELVEKAN
ncbi:MAG: S-layer homology domain-containing protein [bacterium]